MLQDPSENCAEWECVLRLCFQDQHLGGVMGVERWESGSPDQWRGLCCQNQPVFSVTKLPARGPVQCKKWNSTVKLMKSHVLLPCCSLWPVCSPLKQLLSILTSCFWHLTLYCWITCILCHFFQLLFLDVTCWPLLIYLLYTSTT